MTLETDVILSFYLSVTQRPSICQLHNVLLSVTQRPSVSYTIVVLLAVIYTTVVPLSFTQLMSFCNLHNCCPSAIYTTVVPLQFTQLLLSRHLHNCYPVIYTTVFLSFTQRQTPQCFTKVESLFDCLNLPIIIETVLNRVVSGPCIIHICFSAWTRVRKPPANTHVLHVAQWKTLRGLPCARSTVRSGKLASWSSGYVYVTSCYCPFLFFFKRRSAEEIFLQFWIKGLR